MFINMHMKGYNSTDFQNLCRACMSEGQLNQLQDGHMKILEIISKVRYSRTDELPQKICDTCVKKINDIMSFGLLCKRIDQTLKKYLENLKLENFEFPCEKPESCDVEFIDCNNIDSNYVKEDLERLKEEIILQEQNPPAMKPHPFKCKHCARSFAYKRTLSCHMAYIHRRLNYKCPVCLKPFVLLKSLEKHEKIHLKNNRCDTCKKSFLTLNDLEKHKKIHSDAPNLRLSGKPSKSTKNKFLRKVGLSGKNPGLSGKNVSLSGKQPTTNPPQKPSKSTKIMPERNVGLSGKHPTTRPPQKPSKSTKNYFLRNVGLSGKNPGLSGKNVGLSGKHTTTHPPQKPSKNTKIISEESAGLSGKNVGLSGKQPTTHPPQKPSKNTKIISEESTGLSGKNVGLSGKSMELSGKHVGLSGNPTKTVLIGSGCAGSTYLAPDENPDNPYECLICFKTFRFLQNYLKHNMEHNNGTTNNNVSLINNNVNKVF